MQTLTQDSPTTFIHSETVLAGETMEPVFIYGSCSGIQIRVQPGTGDCDIEFSISGAVKVKDDTASWKLKGNYSGDTIVDVTLPVTAIRITANSQDCLVEILAASGGC